MTQTATVLVLKHPEGAAASLDGYVFENTKHATDWLAQPLVRESDIGAYKAVEVVATRSKRRCGCCGAVHWWMMWRGQRVRVRGAWRPPKDSEPVDDGEE